MQRVSVDFYNVDTYHDSLGESTSNVDVIVIDQKVTDKIL